VVTNGNNLIGLSLLFYLIGKKRGKLLVKNKKAGEAGRWMLDIGF